MPASPPFPSFPFPRLSPVPIYSRLGSSQPGDCSVPAEDRKEKIRGATLRSLTRYQEEEDGPGPRRCPVPRPPVLGEPRGDGRTCAPAPRGRAWLGRCRGRARSRTPAPAARDAGQRELPTAGGASGGAGAAEPSPLAPRCARRHVLKCPAEATQVACVAWPGGRTAGSARRLCLTRPDLVPFPSPRSAPPRGSRLPG